MLNAIYSIACVKYESRIKQVRFGIDMGVANFASRRRQFSRKNVPEPDPRPGLFDMFGLEVAVKKLHVDRLLNANGSNVIDSPRKPDEIAMHRGSTTPTATYRQVQTLTDTDRQTDSVKNDDASDLSDARIQFTSGFVRAGLGR
jgi:hypothetical protein